MISRVTLIAKENEEYFQGLLIDSIAKNADVNLGLIDDGVACGAASFKLIEEDKDLKITWLYIDEYYLNDDNVKIFLEQIKEEAIKAGCDTISYSRYKRYLKSSYLDYMNINSRMKDLEDHLLENGFVDEEKSSSVYKLSLGNILSYLKNRGMKTYFGTVQDLSYVSSKLKYHILEAIDNDGELDASSIDFSLYDKDLSRIITANGLFQTAIFIRKTDNGDLWVDAMISAKKANSMNLFIAMKECAKAAMDLGEKYLYINAVNTKIKDLVAHLSGGDYEIVGEVLTYYCVLA